MPELDSTHRARLRKQGQSLDTSIQVGKAGITPTLIDELRAQLEKKGLVKVGLLRSATHETGRDAVAQDLAERAGGRLVEVRGNTALVWKARGETD